MPRNILIKNATLLTMGRPCRVLAGASILVEQDRVGDFREGGILFDSKSTQVVDAEGRVVLPGMVNGHTHLYSSLARGMPLRGTAPASFPEILQRIWWRLDKALDEESIYWSAVTGLVESLRHGVTTLFDHHASPHHVDGSLDLLEEAFRRVGLRGCLCYEVSDRDGMEISQQGILENARYIEKCRAAAARGDYQMRALFGLHASFTLSNATLERARSFAANNACGFHIHVAEDRCDIEDALENHQSTVTERLAHFGILNEQSIAAHGVHLVAGEYTTLAGTQSRVVHNPQSNANNAVGMADVLALLKANVRVGLGTDGFTPNLRDEVRAAFTLQKHLHRDPRPAWEEAYQLAFVENPQMATEIFGLPVGRLEPGAAADLVILDYRPPTPISSENVLGHLYFGLVNAPVDAVMVNGRWLLQQGRLVELDAAELAARAQEAARRLWSRMDS